MAGISTSIQMVDQMTPVIQSITNAMNLMVSGFYTAQSVTSAAFDTAPMAAMQQEVVNTSAELARYQQELERVQNTQVNVPEPTWSSVATPQVFMNSGADRFADEMQSANQMAQQLFQTQRQISEQARSLRVTPPGMLNDVAAVENRIQSLASRIQQLDDIPINLRTDQTNNELENLRRNLVRAVDTQESLNQAMSRMDISAANAAYQQLNNIVSSTEQRIRDNLSMQEQFNQSMRNGQTAASGLRGKLKSIAMSAAAAFSVQKVIALADSATQTTARLNLMNDGLQSTERLNQMIFASAQRARAPYMETASAIAKMGLNAGNAFESNQELIAFMEQVNKQFVIGGATAQEQSNAMVQLSQAMAAGALRGEELNSILDAAPGIARTIEKNMGWAEGSIKQYAAKGAVSAQVVKNSLLNMAEETNTKFNSIPMTFSQVLTTAQTTLLQTFWPIIQMIGKGASFINENWSTIEPVFYGLATGIAAAAAAWGIYTVAQWIANGAAQKFFAGLLANPFFWIAIVIGIIVAAIYRWVQSVGGLRVAWLICVNGVLTAADNLRLGFLAAWIATQNGLDNMQYAFAAFKTGVLNHLGNMKVKGLTIIQDFINGAIDRINKLISTVNNIAGTSIELVGHVEFAAGAAAEEEAKRQQRAADLANLWSQNAADKAARQSSYDRQQRAADDARMQRQAAIAAAKNSAAQNAAENNSEMGGAGDIAANTGKTAGNTAAMADSMDLLDEDLKYMRDAAEQEIINRFTLAELKVDVNNNNTLKTQTDFADVNRMLGDVTAEILAAAAEGGGHV